MRDEVFNVVKKPKYDGYQRGLFSVVYELFDENSILVALSEILATRDKSGTNKKWEYLKELAEQLHKPIIRKFKKRKVHSTFIDNIWDDDLADMQLISKLNKVFRFFCVIDISSKYT